MADIQTGRWGRLIQGAFNLKQRLTLGQVFPDVMSVYDLENRPPEMDAPAGVDRCEGYGVKGAVVAEYPSVLLTLPANSGKIVVIDHVFLVSATAQTVAWTLNGAGSAVANPPAYQDWRRALTSRPTARIQTLGGAAAIIAVAGGAIQLVANQTFELKGPWILAASTFSSLWIQGQTTNSGLTASFRWRERPQEPGELIL